MLRALAATGVLTEARAILYGRPYGEESSFEAYDRVLLQVLDESGLRSLPLITRMDFGHTDPKFILPLGVEAEIGSDLATWRYAFAFPRLTVIAQSRTLSAVQPVAIER